ncbi:MAG: transglycosylase SLT domain-containing protein [Nitrospiraceae bacterium]|nr:transglycosylase SLT domain-containing protein [Nitrospiraceae bacterium]
MRLLKKNLRTIISLSFAVFFIAAIIASGPKKEQLGLSLIAVHRTPFANPVSIKIKRVNKTDERSAVLKWMSKYSSMPVNMMARIYDEAHKHRFPDLLIAMAKVESNFNPEAVSDAGAVGLMQVMGNTWTDELKDQGIIRKEDDLFKISKCMDASAYILDKYLDWKRNNLRDALVCYGGPDHEYAVKILQALGELEAVKGKNKLDFSSVIDTSPAH